MFKAMLYDHVLSLFLNTLDARFHRKEAEALRNPDVVKVEWADGVPLWDRQFCLPGLDAIATAHPDAPPARPSEPRDSHHAS